MMPVAASAIARACCAPSTLNTREPRFVKDISAAAPKAITERQRSRTKALSKRPGGASAGPLALAVGEPSTVVESEGKDKDG